MNVLWLFLCAFALFGLQGWLFRVFGLKRLTASRAFSREAVHAGETITLIEVVRNRKRLPLPWLRLESRIPPALQFAQGENGERTVSGEQYHSSLFYLSGHTQITRKHTVLCTHRGCFDLSSVTLSVGDLFSANSVSQTLSLDLRLIVYPALLPPENVPLPASRWQGEILTKRWLSPDPFLYGGIRAYRPGDPPRAIHWPASARAGELLVKQPDATTAPRALVILNIQTKENLWGEMMPQEREEIERGISLAATLCTLALGQGLSAGFACNGHLVGEKATVVVLPASGEEQRIRLLDVCARLEVQRQLNFHTFLEELAPHVTGQDILLLTSYDSMLIRECEELLRLRGNTVTVLGLDGEQLERERKAG